MFEKLDMLILVVSDMKESIVFYKDLLGLELTHRSSKWTTFKLGDMTLGLQKEVPGTEDERPVKYGVAFAFKVEDVDRTWKELRDKGAPLLAVTRKGVFGRYAEITDPDGHIIMLVEGKK